MATSRKQVVYKAINITAITTAIMLLLYVFNFFYGEQKTQAAELSKVKEDVIILKQTPIISQLISQQDLIKAQRKQIDINTKTLAVLDVQYKAIDEKLNLIYDLVRDNNYAIFSHINQTKTDAKKRN